MIMCYTMIIRNLTLLCATFLAAPLHAEGCPARAAVSLFHSCEISARMTLQFHPLPTEKNDDEILSVTGAYSSADRFGVEGLALSGDQIISKRFQGWDGVLLVSADGEPNIFHAESVRLNERDFNLKRQPDRRVFIEQARADGVSLIQSHLLISTGSLDLKPVDNARRFIRRMVFIDQGGWGIYETKTALTLYEAAVEIQEALNPRMAMNLDMGAYNYCQQKTPTGFQACGELYTDMENLTNLITVKLP